VQRRAACFTGDVSARNFARENLHACGRRHAARRCHCENAGRYYEISKKGLGMDDGRGHRRAPGRILTDAIFAA